MGELRYAQFCALARAAELVGERWTLLVIRELLLGPKRFTDLLERLDAVSPSVLAKRLQRAEKRGLVRRSTLPPPASVTVYELTDDGRALRPAIRELIRWGGRFLFPPRKGDRFEPEWLLLALDACASRVGSPPRQFLVCVHEGTKDAVVHVAGGPGGTSVTTGEGRTAPTTISGAVEAILGLASGRLPPRFAMEQALVHVTGDRAAVSDFPRLFDVGRRREGAGS